jgi:hypothetical protein
MPTSTTERVPSADVTSASWEMLAAACEAVSGIQNSVAAGIAAFQITYTTRGNDQARDSCNRQRNM